MFTMMDDNEYTKIEKNKLLQWYGGTKVTLNKTLVPGKTYQVGAHLVVDILPDVHSKKNFLTECKKEGHLAPSQVLPIVSTEFYSCLFFEALQKIPVRLADFSIQNSTISDFLIVCFEEFNKDSEYVQAHQLSLNPETKEPQEIHLRENLDFLAPYHCVLTIREVRTRFK